MEKAIIQSKKRGEEDDSRPDKPRCRGSLFFRYLERTNERTNRSIIISLGPALIRQEISLTAKAEAALFVN